MLAAVCTRLGLEEAMLAETVAIVATAAAVGSFVFAGLQSRELANQTRFSNQLASTNAMRESMMDLHGPLSVLLDQPELRAYSYEGAEPPSDPLEQARVNTLAEMLADCLDASLQTARELPAFGSANQVDWESYATHLLSNSPALRGLVRKVDWWPTLSGLCESLNFGGDPKRPEGATVAG
jgi:hypothetical protein